MHEGKLKEGMFVFFCSNHKGAQSSLNIMDLSLRLRWNHGYHNSDLLPSVSLWKVDEPFLFCHKSCHDLWLHILPLNGAYPWYWARGWVLPGQGASLLQGWHLKTNSHACSQSWFNITDSISYFERKTQGPQNRHFISWKYPTFFLKVKKEIILLPVWAANSNNPVISFFFFLF